MKILPIPFTEGMVKSLLQNLKRMTRRTGGLEKVNENPDDWEFIFIGYNPEDVNDGTICAYFKLLGFSTWIYLKSKYQIGDKLWVKETYTTLVPEHLVEPLKTKYVYKADCDAESEQTRKDYVAQGYPYKWITGRFMPKTAARIWLEVTDIKCERLQDISNEDAIAEGVSEFGSLTKRYVDYCPENHYSKDELKSGYVFEEFASNSFLTLWESINGIESVRLNPWVFAYTFKRIEKPAG